MKVWVVSELFHPEDTSTGHYLTKIAEELAKEFDVGALCAQPTYARRGEYQPVREQYHGIDIVRVASTTLDKNKLFNRLLNAGTITASLYVNALRRIRRGDIVLVVTNPPTMPYAIQSICRLRGARMVLLVHDVFPETLVTAGLVKRDGLLARTLRSRSQNLYRRSECVIAIGRDMVELVAEMAGGTVAPIFIPNWADLDEIHPTPRSENLFLRELGIEKKFVVEYAGNMGRTHALEPLIEAARKLRHRDDVHFVFAGSGARRPWLEQVVRGLSNATVLPRVERARLNELLNACDLSVVSLAPGMRGVSVPSRTYNVLASGKPLLVLADKGSEPGLIVEEERVGWRVDPNDSDGIVRFIAEAADNPRTIEEMGRRARAVAEAKYSLAQIGQRYRDVIRALARLGKGDAAGLTDKSQGVPEAVMTGQRRGRE